ITIHCPSQFAANLRQKERVSADGKEVVVNTYHGIAIQHFLPYGSDGAFHGSPGSDEIILFMPHLSALKCSSVDLAIGRYRYIVDDRDRLRHHVGRKSLQEEALQLASVQVGIRQLWDNDVGSGGAIVSALLSARVDVMKVGSRERHVLK